MRVAHEPTPETAAELARRLDARYRTPLMNYFLRRVRDRAEAEDLTQEVFLRIVRRGDPEPLENAEVFLFSIAGNLLRDRARRAQTRHRADHRSLDEAADLPAQPALIEDRGPERVLMSQESLAEVLSALDELGERTRDIFILYRLEKMKHREIGALYGLSASAVEKYVRKATAHLARLFGER
ncbi:MAG TPA: sigma-70 family RNA polymerase sigma factor [Caulobacteraceae bacterium]